MLNSQLNWWLIYSNALSMIFSTFTFFASDLGFTVEIKHWWLNAVCVAVNLAFIIALLHHHYAVRPREETARIIDIFR